MHKPDENEVELLAAIHGAHILLVDDSPLYLDIVEHFLGTVGATVNVARNGLEAMDLLAIGGFDCVLMDVQMPVMDGIEAIRRIRSNPTMSSMHVIAMTGNTSDQARELCLSSGMDDFIGKPFKRHDLISKLAAWLPGKAKSN